MTGAEESEALIRKVKEWINEHFYSPEVEYYLDTPFTPARARCWVTHVNHFVRHRRDCWALAMGQAPLDVKREIWLHEQDELIADPRAGGMDHFTLSLQEAELLGVNRAELESAELHPFVAPCLSSR